MITAAQYQHQISELDLSALEQGPGDGLQALREKLLELERSINHDIHVLRTQYQARLTSARAGASSQILVSNKRSLGSRKRDEEALRVETERDEKLAPYLEIKEKVAELLAKAEQAGAKA